MPQLGCRVCVVDGVFQEVAGGTVALAAVLHVPVIFQVNAAAVEGAELMPPLCDACKAMQSLPPLYQPRIHRHTAIAVLNA